MGSVRIELMRTRITAVLTGNNRNLCCLVSHLKLNHMYLEESFKNISVFSNMTVQWQVRKSWDSTLETSYLATSGTSYLRLLGRGINRYVYVYADLKWTHEFLLSSWKSHFKVTYPAHPSWPHWLQTWPKSLPTPCQSFLIILWCLPHILPLSLLILSDSNTLYILHSVVDVQNHVSPEFNYISEIIYIYDFSINT